MTSRQWKIGSLFAAIGGFGQAFSQLGQKFVWANEKDEFAVQTFEANFPKVRMIARPVETLSVKKDELEPVDILTAGFPCQPFSIAGEKRGFKDERGELFLDIIRIVKEFRDSKPKIILLENVSNFRSHDSGRTFKRVQSEIQKAGYWFSEKDAQILNTCTHTEIPQNRARIFMVAVRSDLFARNPFVFPDELPPGSRKCVWDYLDSAKKQAPENYFHQDSQYLPLFLDAIQEHGRRAVFQLRRNYVRVNRSGVCFTLMANMGEGGHNQPVVADRWGVRKLTPRECARLQGYEDSWFVIPESLSRTQIYKQLGNSVTVPLVKRIGENCLEALNSMRVSRNNKSA